MESILNCDILFINPPYQRRKDSGVSIPLGLGYLSAFTRLNGFTPFVLDCVPSFASIDDESLKNMKQWLTQKLSEIKPQLAVGIGPCTLSSVKSVITIEQVCRTVLPGIPIIYGGPLASIQGLEWFFFEYLHANAVIPGDAELVLSNLLTALKSTQKSQVKGVSYSSDHKFIPNIIKNLNMLPFPARDLFDDSHYFLSIRRDLFLYPFASLMCSRGCPHDCGFCSSSILRNRIQSRRSLENVSQEIEMLTKNMDVKSIVFFDDCSFSNQSRINEEITEFSEMIEKAGKKIVWQIEMRPDVASSLNETAIKSMCKSGCRQINMGMEKGTLNGLQSIEKTLQPEHSVEACKRIRSVSPRIRLAGTFILGGPGETYKEAMQTVDFSRDLGLLFAHFYPLEVYPGTRLYEQKYGSDMRAWLPLVLQDSVFKGSLIFEDLLERGDLAELTCEAYRAFYRRKNWISLGKRLLGSHFEKVSSRVFSWGENTRW